MNFVHPEVVSSPVERLVRPAVYSDPRECGLD